MAVAVGVVGHVFVKQNGRSRGDSSGAHAHLGREDTTELNCLLTEMDASNFQAPVILSMVTMIGKYVSTNQTSSTIAVEEQHKRVGEKSLLSISTFVQTAQNNVLLAVPAFLYAINNYLKFIMQLYFNPATVKMLSNPKAIDAVDNGINQYDTDQPPRYVNNTHLSSRVGRFNLDWIDPDQSPEKENEAFRRAMTLDGSEFLDSVRFHATSWLLARSIVMQCLEARHDADPSGEIMVPNKFFPVSLLPLRSSV